MGFNNPDMPWSELERRLSGRPRPPGKPENADGLPIPDGGDSPAWGRRRVAYEPPASATPPASTVPYAELHAHSTFSFLDGASQPEELAEEAARLGLEAIALTDHDGFYGVVRFAEAAGALGVRTIFGAELSLGVPAPQNGIADPEGNHLLVLARDPEGYRRLGLTITAGQMAGEKGRPVYDLEEVAAASGGHWVVLTGCRKGHVRSALDPIGPQPPGILWSDRATAAARELDRLVDLFGRDQRAGRAHRSWLPTRLRPQRRACRARPPSRCRRGGDHERPRRVAQSRPARGRARRRTG